MGRRKHRMNKAWMDLMCLVEKRDGYKCQHCGLEGWQEGATDRPTLHVHHLTYERFNNELPEDLMMLCASCHPKEHGRLRLEAKR